PIAAARDIRARLRVEGEPRLQIRPQLVERLRREHDAGALQPGRLVDGPAQDVKALVRRAPVRAGDHRPPVRLDVEPALPAYPGEERVDILLQIEERLDPTIHVG